MCRKHLRSGLEWVMADDREGRRKEGERKEASNVVG